MRRKNLKQEGASTLLQPLFERSHSRLWIWLMVPSALLQEAHPQCLESNGQHCSPFSIGGISVQQIAVQLYNKLVGAALFRVNDAKMPQTALLHYIFTECQTSPWFNSAGKFLPDFIRTLSLSVTLGEVTSGFFQSHTTIFLCYSIQRHFHNSLFRIVRISFACSLQITMMRDLSICE